MDKREDFRLVSLNVIYFLFICFQTDSTSKTSPETVEPVANGKKKKKNKLLPELNLGGAKKAAKTSKELA